MKSLKINFTPIILFLFLVSVFSGCGANIHNLNSDNDALATYTAHKLLQDNQKINVSSKDFPELLTALHSENQLVKKAAIRSFCIHPNQALAYVMSEFSNTNYLITQKEEKMNLALSFFNQFPDSLEKIEYLSIVLRRISEFDMPLARTLMDKIDIMKDRVPENQKQDLVLIDVFQTCLTIHSDTSNTLQSIQKILDNSAKNAPESTRFHMFKHIIYTLDEIHHDVPEAIWNAMEKIARSFDSNKKRADSFLLLAQTFAGHINSTALDYLKKINTGANGYQYHYLLDNLDLIPEKSIEILSIAREMASTISEKKDRIQAYLEIALKAAPLDYYFSRSMVKDLEQDDDARSHLLGTLAFQKLSTEPGRAQYLNSLIVFSSNQNIYYYMPAIGKIAVTNINQARKMQPDLSKNPFLEAEILLSKIPSKPDSAQELYNESLQKLKSYSLDQREKFKIRFIQALSRFDSDKALSLTMRNIQSITRIEKEKELISYFDIWIPKLKNLNNFPTKNLWDPLISRVNKMTNENIQEDLLYEMISAEANQDIRYAAPHFSVLSPGLSLDILINWLYKNEMSDETELLRALFSSRVNLTKINFSLNAYPMLIQTAMIFGISSSPHTNLTTPIWQAAFDESLDDNLREQALKYYILKQDKELLNIAIDTITNNRMSLIQDELVDILSAHKTAIPWSSFQNYFFNILKDRDSSSKKKINIIRLCTTAQLNGIVEILERIINSEESSKDLKTEAILALGKLNATSSAPLIAKKLKESTYFTPAITSLQLLKAYNLLIDSYDSSVRKDEIVEVLQVYRPDLMKKKKVGYIGYVIPWVWYQYQKKGYPITFYSANEKAAIDKCDLIIEANYKTEYNEEVSFSSSESQKVLKGEYHVLSMKVMNTSDEIIWDVQATGFGSPWSEDIVEGPGDPQDRINDLAKKLTLKDFERKLENLDGRIPFNFTYN